jgi:hypothetical protein
MTAVVLPESLLQTGCEWLGILAALTRQSYKTLERLDSKIKQKEAHHYFLTIQEPAVPRYFSWRIDDRSHGRPERKPQKHSTHHRAVQIT